MKIYGNDCRTGKKSNDEQPIYIPSEKGEKKAKRLPINRRSIYDAKYQIKRTERAKALSEELKADPNHPKHGAPATDNIRKKDWCMCEKCKARREVVREKHKMQKRAARQNKRYQQI